jgi:N-acetylmuramoyl-L-alanine amidase
MNKQIKIVVIGDKAHGIKEKGKGSPDGTHREYKWSRERWAQIEIMCKAAGIPLVFTSFGDDEPGRTNRVIAGNAIAAKYPKHLPVFISLHNDASKSDGTWGSASGVSVWTCKARNTSDILAEIMLKRLFEWLPETRHRIYSPKEGERDFENDFTVLAGTPAVRPNYHAMLLEIGFQDNKEDLHRLKDPAWNKKVEDSIMDGIEDINRWALQNIK